MSTIKLVYKTVYIIESQLAFALWHECAVNLWYIANLITLRVYARNICTHRNILLTTSYYMMLPRRKSTHNYSVTLKAINVRVNTYVLCTWLYNYVSLSSSVIDLWFSNIMHNCGMWVRSKRGSCGWHFIFIYLHNRN